MIPRSFCLYLTASALVIQTALNGQTSNTTYPNTPRKPVVVHTQQETPTEDFIDFKLHGGDIDAVLDALEAFTGKSVIRPGTLPVMPGGYTIDLHHLKKADAIVALETLLTLNQLGVSPLGEQFLKVVPLSTVKGEAPQYIQGSTLDLPSSNQIVTKLFQPKFLRVTELFGSTLQGMLSAGVGGGVVVLDKANSALVTDTLANLQRLEILVNAVDQPVGGNVPKFYTLQYAKASDLVTKIHALLTGPAAAKLSTTTVYNADDRTNQVIVICDPREIPFFDDLISKLDGKADPNTRTEVIYLKHANAKDIGTTLSALISGEQTAAQKISTQSVRPGEVATGNPNPNGGNQAARTTATVNTTAQGTSTNEFSSLMTIVPDDRSNSIVVSGTLDDIRLMHELIEKLDAPLPQVRIEVIIAEVDLTDTDQSGLTALGLTMGTAANGKRSITNFTGSIAGWDFSSGVVNPLAFQSVMNATSAGSKNLVHILSTPVIVTAHGKQAEVTSGEQVPISSSTTSTPVTGSTSGFATTGTTSYQKIAIDLKVTPLIGDNGDVQLTIDQKVDDILGQQVLNGNSTPIISDREANSYVTVKSGDMIVLGGLQRTSKSVNQNKIGLLYEIPIVSQLLGGNTTILNRTELLFFIRPTIITPDRATPDTQQRIKQLSNSSDVEKYLADPTPQSNSKVKDVIDRFKNN